MPSTHPCGPSTTPTTSTSGAPASPATSTPTTPAKRVPVKKTANLHSPRASPSQKNRKTKKTQEKIILVKNMNEKRKFQRTLDMWKNRENSEKPEFPVKISSEKEKEKGKIVLLSSSSENLVKTDPSEGPENLLFPSNSSKIMKPNCLAQIQSKVLGRRK